MLHWTEIGQTFDMDAPWTEFGHLIKYSNCYQVAHLEPTCGPPGAHLRPTWGLPGARLGGLPVAQLWPSSLKHRQSLDKHRTYLGQGQTLDRVWTPN